MQRGAATSQGPATSMVQCQDAKKTYVICYNESRVPRSKAVDLEGELGMSVTGRLRLERQGRGMLTVATTSKSTARAVVALLSRKGSLGH